MAIAEGIGKRLAYKKEVTWGVLPGATAAQVLRRVTGTFNLNKETYQSDEIRTDYQMSDYRHGIRSVEGSVNGELSPGTYADFFAAALAKNFVAGATTGPVAVIEMDATAGKLVRSTGSFLTNGFKVGDVVRATGFTDPDNNGRNLLVTSVIALEMGILVLDGGDLVDEAEGDTVTIAVAGKKTFAPLTGHTSDSFTFEEWYNDISVAEVFTGNKVNSIGVQLPATGLATLDLAFMGKDLDKTASGAAAYFTTPTASNTNGIFAAVNGALIVNGAVVGLVTGLNFTINRNLSQEAVVGSNVYPDIFDGRILVDGEFTAFFESPTYRDYFINEDEVALSVVLTTSNEPDAEFMSITLPRIKVNGAAKDDGEKGIVRTFPFQALLAGNKGTGTDAEATTISIQDSTQ